MIEKVGLVALGITIGWMLLASANFIMPNSGGTIIRSIVSNGVHYTVCVPPWDTRDAQGVIHHYGDVP